MTLCAVFGYCETKMDENIIGETTIFAYSEFNEYKNMVSNKIER